MIDFAAERSATDPHRTSRWRGLAIASVLAIGPVSLGVATASAAEPGEEPHRPSVHYTPDSNWMNDPNGLVFVDDTYHMYYQYNPEGNRWGNMSWGHATSTDLLHWEEQPVAIRQTFNDQNEPIEDIFSGSVVVDESNSSGFGINGEAPLVAIYTSAYAPLHPTHAGKQAQSLAYSTDGGFTWTKYSGNPVLDRGSANFRDPKVFWYDGDAGQYWVLVAVEATDHKVVLYKSDDLKNWEHLSDFGPANSVSGIWECPDLFELPVDGDPENTKWVMVVNLNPGAVNGGSGGQYFVGDFDGTTFTSETTEGAVPAPAGTVFAGFDSGSFDGWTVQNDAGSGPNGPWGLSPAAGSLPGQNPVSGWEGAGLANGFVDGDWPRGTMESPTFTISDPFINLLVGGGRHPHVPGSQLGNSPPEGITLFDFEVGGALAESGWQLTGDFATDPSRSPSTQGGEFFLGDKRVNTFEAGPLGDNNIGDLVSPEFTIDDSTISFLIGGGRRNDGTLEAQLLVDDEVVRSETGRNDGALNWASWDVSDLEGSTARLRIHDSATGGWGHLTFDHVVIGSEPAMVRSNETSVNLIVDGAVVRSATGTDSERLDWTTWNVAEFEGQQATIRAIDNNRGGWGHLLFDQVIFGDAPSISQLEAYDWLDWGRDYYATVSYFGTPSGSRIMQGWMNNWDYANDIPTSPWRSSMALPREVTLVSTPEGPRLSQRVVPQLDAQLQSGSIQTRQGVAVSGPTDLGLAGDVAKVSVVLRPGDSEKLGISVFGNDTSGTLIGYDTQLGRLFVDRRNSGDVSFHPAFASLSDVPVGLAEDGTISFEVYLDRASVEVFTGDGLRTITEQVFPDAGAIAIDAWSEGGAGEVEEISVTPITPTMRVDPGTEYEPTVERVSGTDRFQTAVQISQESYPDTAPVVYVANGRDYPDALSAGPAAAFEGGPLLLVGPDNLPPVVSAEIARLDPARIVVVGGTPSVGDAVYDQLTGMAEEITRLSGANRYETSRMVAEHAFGEAGASLAYIATGTKFPDALAAGGAAGAAGAPVILVNGGGSGLDAATETLLADLGITDTRVLGDVNSVSDDVFFDVDQVTTAVRLAGADRYETSRAINADAFETAEHAFLATGANFPDALAGSAWAGKSGSPLYTVRTDCVPQGVLDDLEALGVTKVTLLGGLPSLGEAVAELTAC